MELSNMYWKTIYSEKKGNKDFIRGLKAGITAYAVWKDGEQVVGPMQKNIKDVFKEIDQELGGDKMKSQGEVNEVLAEIAHAVWSHMINYQFDAEMIDEDKNKARAHRWRRQAKASYATLSEEEKQSDRQIAMEIIQKMLTGYGLMVVNIDEMTGIDD